MINVSEPYLPDLNKYTRLVAEVWDNKIITNRGPLVQKLEAKIASFHNVSEVITVSNCTIGIELSLRILAKRPTGKVIVTPFTFKATICAIENAGYQPVYCDIGENGNLDPEAVRKAMSADTVAIVPVHVYGVPCDDVSLSEISHEYDVPIIYDAAHCFGVTHNEKAIISWGDASVISLHATKGVNCGEGGAVYFRDKRNYDKLKQISNFNLVNKYEKFSGTNAKLSELQGALGLSVIEDIDLIFEKRRNIEAIYRAQLPNGINFIQHDARVKNNNLYAPLKLSNSVKIEQLAQFLQQQNIASRRYFYPPMTTNCERALNLSLKILCIPCHPNLTKEETYYICEKINAFAKEYSL